jgi:hypothetical protein
MHGHAFLAQLPSAFLRRGYQADGMTQGSLGGTIAEARPARPYSLRMVTRLGDIVIHTN